MAWHQPQEYKKSALPDLPKVRFILEKKEIPSLK
jgi:hypothetical protein